MQLTKEQIKEFEAFVSKIPISKVRSDIERMWDTIKSNGYIFHMDELDTLKEHSLHLPDDLQPFVQSFSHWVKNEDANVKPEEVKKEVSPDANLGKLVADTTKKSKVVDKDTEDKTVSDFDDVDNQDAPKESHEKKDARKELTKEAQAGDLKRPISGMKNKDYTPKEKKIDKNTQTKRSIKSAKATKKSK